ncbi:MAG: hypothetical protein MJZ17_05635 [Bacteroidales bacterium]|nr:hypothetical protein [Bacteroidales bacterium]
MILITKEDVKDKIHGSIIRVAPCDVYSSKKALLFLSDTLNWCMATDDCGVKYWYNIKTCGDVVGNFSARKRDVATIGYTISSFLLHRVKGSHSDVVKLCDNGSKAAYVRLQDFVDLFGDDMNAIRRSLVTGALEDNPGMVRLFTNLAVLLPPSKVDMLGEVRMAAWQALHNGIEGLV